MSRSLTCTPIESISAERIFGALLSLDALGFAAGDGHDIDESSAVEKNAMVERLHLRLHFVHYFLPAMAARRSDSSTGSNDCASSRVKVRSDIRVIHFSALGLRRWSFVLVVRQLSAVTNGPTWRR